GKLYIRNSVRVDVLKGHAAIQVLVPFRSKIACDSPGGSPYFWNHRPERVPGRYDFWKRNTTPWEKNRDLKRATIVESERSLHNSILWHVERIRSPHHSCSAFPFPTHVKVTVHPFRNARDRQTELAGLSLRWRRRRPPRRPPVGGTIPDAPG